MEMLWKLGGIGIGFLFISHDLLVKTSVFYFSLFCGGIDINVKFWVEIGECSPVVYGDDYCL